MNYNCISDIIYNINFHGNNIMTKELENKISKLLNDKNYEEALKLCYNAIKSNSEDFQIYIYRGLAKNNLNRYEEAIEDYNASLKLNSNNPDTYYFIGLSKDNLGLYEEAINNYDKAIELNPAYIPLYQKNRYFRKTKFGRNI